MAVTAPILAPHGDSAVVDVLGLRLHALSSVGAMTRLMGFIHSGEPHQVITADATSMVIAVGDAAYRRLLRDADLVTADGAGLLWAARRCQIRLPARVSGVDLAAGLCSRSGHERYDVYLFGGAPGVAERAANHLCDQFPGCRIVGVAHGFQDAAGERAVLDDIAAKRPDVLLVGMGIPRQEKWIALHQERLRVPVAMGVGGSLDVFAGVVRRAPIWMQAHGLEWLFRLLQDPRKLKKVAILPRFVWRVLLRRRLPDA